MIDVLEIVPGKGGIFDVHVDGELVFTKSMIGRYPQPDDVVAPLLERHRDAAAREVCIEKKSHRRSYLPAYSMNG